MDGGSTVTTLVSDFEDAGGPYVFSDFEGGVVTVEDNPDATGINTSARVAQMLKFAGAVFGGSTLTLGTPVDIPVGSSYHDEGVRPHGQCRCCSREHGLHMRSPGRATTRCSSSPSLQPARLMPGDTITISFDMKGSAVAGGIVFPELIDERSDMGATGQLLDTIVAPTPGWTSYFYSPMAGPDVAGGITFQIAVVCGGDPACSNDVYIDNVSVMISGGGG